MESEKVRNIHLQREPHRAEYGHLINRAIPLYEDPTRYNVGQLVDLFNLQWEMVRAADDETRKEKMAAFEKAIDAVKPLTDAPQRVYLWKEGTVGETPDEAGVMPQETVYEENPGYVFDHDPDFKPYYLEMLLPEDVTPKGGVVLVAGGSHGAGTINECYQVGLEFNAAGFQAFILQCRPNGCPWSKLETATDAARAFRLIRQKAEEYRLNPDHLAYAGFSNGGVTGDHQILFYSQDQATRDYFPDYQPDEADAFSGKSNAYLCVYGARHMGTEYPEENVSYPPTFFAIGRHDFVCCDNLFKEHLPYLQRHEVPYEIHTFAAHPHGYAGWKIIDGNNDPNFDLWVNHAVCFLEDAFDICRWQKPEI